MDTSKLLHILELPNGLIATISDLTKVYFGDYYHVRINIVCFFDESSANSYLCCSDDINLGSISYTRTLDRMGVPSKDVQTVTDTLINDFRSNSLPYISSQDFPKKLIHNEIANTKRHIMKYAGSRL